MSLEKFSLKSLKIIDFFFQFSDRIRTTNNMLGDCYTCAVVEHLSKEELMKTDDEIIVNDKSSKKSCKYEPELIVVSVDEKI